MRGVVEVKVTLIIGRRRHREVTVAVWEHELGSKVSSNEAVRHAAPGWPLPTRERYLQIRIDRDTAVALLVSLLLHALLLITLPSHDLFTPPARAPEQSITVRLNTVELQPPPEPAPVLPEPVPEPKAEPTPPKPEPEPPQPRTKPEPKPAPKSKPDAPDIIALDKRADENLEVPAPALAPPPAPPPAQDAPTAAPTDMMAYVNAARERRRQAELEVSRQNAEAAARERGPTAEELKDAIIKRNLRLQGTNGVFQILGLDSTHARFSFRGWTSDYNNARRQVIEVEVAPGDDIRRATVRRMISLIREYYQGDFNWESRRLDRVVILSARPEDNAGLEDFLIEEFFGTQGLAFQ